MSPSTTMRLGAVAAVTALTFALQPATIGTATVTSPVHAALGSVGDETMDLPDLDVRTGSVQPTAAQRELASGLGTVRWNRFGTPQSLINHDVYLATGLRGENAVAAARSWLRANRELFRLSERGVAELELVNDAKLADAGGYAVLFTQRYGGLLPAVDGQVVVGVTGSAGAGWKVAYASSSVTGESPSPPLPALGPREAWLAAARTVGRSATIAQLSDVVGENDWSRFAVNGFSYFQRVRLRALPTPSDAVRPVYEAIVLDHQAGAITGYTVLVDAVTGQALLRRNDVQDIATPAVETFTGQYGPGLGECGKSGPFTSVPATKQIIVAVKSTVDVNDIVIHLYLGDPDAGGRAVANFDSGTSPEAIVYDARSDQHPTDYFVTVCPFAAGTEDGYQGAITFQDVAGGPDDLFVFPPKWRLFAASPGLQLQTGHPTYDLSDADTRLTGCWTASGQFVTKDVSDCDLVFEDGAPHAMPWDVDPRTGQPTGTTFGNNAFSAEAWLAAVVPPPVGPVALGPGPTGHTPTSPTRDYLFAWQDRWNEERCGQTAYGPSLDPASGGNDVDSAATNLFVQHNRMHDWSYHLGFTEKNFNFQVSNFGTTGVNRENDPEVGSVQAGAITGAPEPTGLTTYSGRNNANQLTLPDGVPGLTNMYLWQPRAGAGYPPCVDGDYDTSVIAHEYGHGIQNRMVAGPDQQLSGHQARAMGESWSDLTAIEFLGEFGYVPVNGENPFAVGPYVTGNLQRGIRNYGMNASPLNYSDVGYDTTGALSPHADGEIWSAVNFDLRKALIEKYDAAYPSSSRTLQIRCAEGDLPADQCPGNRRWIQLVHDAFLLMASGAVTMVDARDAFLAADRMRFAGANQVELWRAFARRGLGTAAQSTPPGPDELDPRPSFASAAEANADVRFVVKGGDGDTPEARVFAGSYEARAVPVADTDPGTPLGSSAQFVPGTYQFVVAAPGYGHLRFERTFSSAPVTVTVTLPANLASASQGASASGDGGNFGHLIDDAEATNWVAFGRTPSVAGTQVTVNLAGAAPVTVNRVNVSAMLRPVLEGDFDDNDDPAQPRFSALRAFEIWACTSAVANAGCTLDHGFTKIFTSPSDAFPGVRFRPVSPDLILRSFTVPNTTATHLRLVVVSNQCTGGAGFQDEQDADSVTTTDCETGSTLDNEVRAAELQAFSVGGKVTQRLRR
jgi:extracellular elastinolytic metalloproteinase